jgi:uncharacterized protein (DUF302 family)
MKFKLFLIGLVCATILNAGDYIVKSSKNSVNATVSKIEKIVKAKGMSVFGIINHRANAKKIGSDMQEAKVIIFGNPKLGTRMMQRDIRVGIDLPIRILVYKDFDGKTKIEYLKPKVLQKRFDLAGCAVIPKMTKALDMITTKAGA